MAVRVRKNGKIFCARLSNPENGDIYIDDAIHYLMSVEKKLLVTTENEYHMNNGGEWWWKNEVPENIQIDNFYKI